MDNSIKKGYDSLMDAYAKCKNDKKLQWVLNMAQKYAALNGGGASRAAVCGLVRNNTRCRSGGMGEKPLLFMGELLPAM